MEYIA